MPERLIDVQTKLGDLKSAFNRQDYQAVVKAAPPVLLEAQGLASEAAAKKVEVMKALNDQWTSLSAAVPEILDGDPQSHRSVEQEIQPQDWPRASI